jgi:hypothetical protein
MRVDAYLSGGTASGMVHVDGHLRDLLETGTDLTMSGVTWRPFGAPASAVGDVAIAIDDLLLAVSDEEPFIAMHHAWHDVGIDVGPYRLVGQLPTLPGFDPGRALTRPTGGFVLLRDVALEPLDASGQTLALPHALINRYAVDRVRAHLMLGFFFPGAEIEASEPAVEASEPASA